MKNHYIREQSNLSTLSSGPGSKVSSNNFSSFIETGTKSFFDICSDINGHLIFTREYEHALGLITAVDGSIDISYLEMPHPSGITCGDDGSVYVLSTRTPHLLYRFKYVYHSNHEAFLVPDLIRVLPGCLYAHELLAFQAQLLINATGLNQVLSLKADFTDNLKNFYRPKFIPEEFDNCMQLNSLCVDSNHDYYSTCFSTIKSDFKPWKDEIGPVNKGGIIRHHDDQIIVDNLTCPHSVRSSGDKLFYCNSGYGEVFSCNLDGSDRRLIATLDGFTRGLIIQEKYLFVGLSKVQSGKNKYAPGLNPNTSKCGIATLERDSGKVVNIIEWINGEQIFDIQLLTVESNHSLYLPQSRSSITSTEPSTIFYRLGL